MIKSIKIPNTVTEAIHCMTNRSYRGAVLNLHNLFSRLIKTFAASELVSSPAISCPVIWSVIFIFVIFSQPVHSVGLFAQFLMLGCDARR